MLNIKLITFFVFIIFTQNGIFIFISIYLFICLHLKIRHIKKSKKKCRYFSYFDINNFRNIIKYYLKNIILETR